MLSRVFLYSIDHNTKISNLSTKKINCIVDKCLSFCKENLGVNKRKRKPLTIIVDYNPYDEVYFGEYYPSLNEIRIYKDEIKTVEDFCKVFIHEYTHYLQPVLTKYSKMLDDYGYESHPFEIEANLNEDIYINDLKRILEF